MDERKRSKMLLLTRIATVVLLAIIAGLLLVLVMRNQQSKTQEGTQAVISSDPVGIKVQRRQGVEDALLMEEVAVKADAELTETQQTLVESSQQQFRAVEENALGQKERIAFKQFMYERYANLASVQLIEFVYEDTHVVRLDIDIHDYIDMEEVKKRITMAVVLLQELLEQGVEKNPDTLVGVGQFYYEINLYKYERYTMSGFKPGPASRVMWEPKLPMNMQELMSQVATTNNNTDDMGD